MTALYRTGWGKSIEDPEHEVRFEQARDGMIYLRSELSWLAGDLATNDPAGDEALKVAAIILLSCPIPGTHTYTWKVGETVYFVARDEEEARKRKFG